MSELSNPPKKGLLGFTSILPQPEWHYELWGKDVNNKPIFKWFSPSKNEWVEDTFRGDKLPKNALKFIGHYARRYQTEQLESGNKDPWGLKK
tara:strand:- start:839 stop:1114 length:276 start_codon:yes stop_codon:yes gene_type:complete